MTTTENPRVLPILHLNGSGARNLLEQHSAMLRALHDTLDAFAQATPHGRDFYVVPGLLEKAMVQHTRRVKVLQALRDEIEAEAEAIADLAQGREPRRRV